jgi:A nuclease family of the HNH/ENDO VII superfamily with conserved AHH
LVRAKPKNELIVPPKNQLIEQPKPGLPSDGDWLRSSLGWLSRRGRFGVVALRMGLVLAEKVSFLSSLGDYIESLLEGPQIEGSTGNIDADEMGAAEDLPKTLEELQKEPTRYRLGYDRHHIVEQNPANIAKRYAHWEILLRKFGRAMIDDPDNLVWIPRRKHWRITAMYNSKEKGDPIGRLHRQVVSELDFASQRDAGLAALRKEGILK